MKNLENRGLVSHFRRAGPPALLAACLAIGPAFAQSSTTTIRTGEPTTETTKTKIKEKHGDTVVKQKTMSDDVDTTVKTKSKTTVDDGSTTVKVR